MRHCAINPDVRHRGASLSFGNASEGAKVMQNTPDTWALAHNPQALGRRLPA